MGILQLATWLSGCLSRILKQVNPPTASFFWGDRISLRETFDPYGPGADPVGWSDYELRDTGSGVFLRQCAADGLPGTHAVPAELRLCLPEVTARGEGKPDREARGINVFDHPDFGGPGNVFGRSDFGAITTVGGFPRLLQIMVRYAW